MTSKAPDAEKPEFSRRSWYMPAHAADALAKAVDDLHFELRLPKGELLGLIVTEALKHLDQVRENARSR